MAPPLPEQQLKEIATKACDATLDSATCYSHSSTMDWNGQIIKVILEELIEKTSTPEAPPQFKFAVNSTIIQHVAPGEEGVVNQAKRGMHSAAGAYWNNEKDGMWSYKYEGAEKKGLDVVISVMWIAI